MAEIQFSNAARMDLKYIDDYSIVKFGEEVAISYMLGFKQAFAKLQAFPRSAPVWPELGENIHCLNYRQHRILYTTDGEQVLVVRVVHHAMDARRALKKAAG